MMFLLNNAGLGASVSRGQPDSIVMNSDPVW